MVVSVRSQNFLQQDKIKPSIKFKPDFWQARNKLKAYFLMELDARLVCAADTSPKGMHRAAARLCFEHSH